MEEVCHNELAAEPDLELRPETPPIPLPDNYPQERAGYEWVASPQAAGHLLETSQLGVRKAGPPALCGSLTHFK